MPDQSADLQANDQAWQSIHDQAIRERDAADPDNAALAAPRGDGGGRGRLVMKRKDKRRRKAVHHHWHACWPDCPTRKYGCSSPLCIWIGVQAGTTTLHPCWRDHLPKWR